MSDVAPKIRKVRRDLHFRVSDSEHRALQALADEYGEFVAVVLRRIIRQAIQAATKKVGTAPVPPVLFRPDSPVTKPPT